MGRVAHSRRGGASKKKYNKSHKTDNRARDIDQVQDDLIKEVNECKKKEFEYDEDLPGAGQHYCTPCARHFGDDDKLQQHIKSKVHKRRLRDVAQAQYSHTEAEAAAGKTKEILPKLGGAARDGGGSMDI
jgi:bud site selection protein 20